MVFRSVACAFVLAGPVGVGADRHLESQEAGKNPLRKVVTLLQSMAKKVSAEGEREKDLFDEFLCYCKTGEAQLSESISGNNAKVPSVQSDIESGEAEVAQLELDLKHHQTDRDAAKTAIAEATSLREKEHADFVKDESETQGYIDALSKAIPAIQSGMSGTKLLQTSTTAAALRRAAASDEQLTDDDRQSVISFLADSAEVSDMYVPSSGEVLGILKTMNEDYAKDLAQITSTETDAVKVFDELVAAKTREEKTLGTSIEKKTARVGNLKVEVVKMKQDLSEAQTQLIQDQKMLGDLGVNCKASQGEFDKRVLLRSQEIVAIQDTIKILNDDDALELAKKTLPSPGTFMQMKTRKEAARESALTLIRAYLPRAVDRPEVRFLELSLMTKKVDFSKVLKMIDSMVGILEEEQTDDNHKKEYCNKEMDVVENKVKGLEKDIDDIATAVEEQTERITGLADEIKVTKEGVGALDKMVAEETEQRKKENEEYTDLMSSNTAAKELLEFAKNRLNKFYNPKQYTAPPKKEEAALNEESIFEESSPDAPLLLQVGAVSLHKLDPAPKPFADDYSKKSEESGGVIGMIDTLIADLTREMTEAEVQEKNSQREYEEYMADSAKKRAKDVKAIAIKDGAKADAEQLKLSLESTSREESDELQATTSYQGQVHTECDWLLQNFDLRKTARAEEVDNLKKAKATLSGADFSLMQEQKPAGAFLKPHKQA